MYRISVPATTANIGPGFDSFGLALTLYNHFTIGQCDDLMFENCEIKNCQDNLVYTSAMEVFKNYYKDVNFPKGMYIKFDTAIPLSRGLGSSATCITAGVIGANLLLGEPYSLDDLFELAVKIEGHPDNIAPAFFGGLNICAVHEDRVYHKKVAVSPRYKFAVLIPKYQLSTSSSRVLLPEKVHLKDAVSNISNASLTLLSLMDGDATLLKEVLEDKLHEPYRKKMVSDFDWLKAKALESGAIGCFLSGAGPSILCIIKNPISFRANMVGLLKELPIKWDLQDVEIDNDGAKWQKCKGGV